MTHYMVTCPAPVYNQPGTVTQHFDGDLVYTPAMVSTLAPIVERLTPDSRYITRAVQMVLDDEFVHPHFDSLLNIALIEHDPPAPEDLFDPDFTALDMDDAVIATTRHEVMALALQQLIFEVFDYDDYDDSITIDDERVDDPIDTLVVDNTMVLVATADASVGLPATVEAVGIFNELGVFRKPFKPTETLPIPYPFNDRDEFAMGNNERVTTDIALLRTLEFYELDYAKFPAPIRKMLSDEAAVALRAIVHKADAYLRHHDNNTDRK